MAKVSKITDEMLVKGKGEIDFYMLKGILPVARSWPKRRETPFRPRELEAQGVFSILMKATTLIQDKVKEAWVVESIGKRPRWQDTFLSLGMKYWGKNGEIPPILIDYQIHWHSPNPELELLLEKLNAMSGKTEAQVIITTGIISLEEIETYREKLYFSIYDIEGLRLIAPFLEFIIGKNIDFITYLQELVGFIEEPMKVCFSDADVRTPKSKTYYYHGVKYDCVIEINPIPHKCIPLEESVGIHTFIAVEPYSPGNKIMTTVDGVHWKMRTGIDDHFWTGICWSPTLGLWCAIGQAGIGNRVMISRNGKDWHLQNSAADNKWEAICWSPELSLFCAVASSGSYNRVMTSPDGINWTIRRNSYNSHWQSICWSPYLGMFVAVAVTPNGYKIMTSSNGTYWRNRAAPNNNYWAAVCWSPLRKIFCAVAQSGVGNRVMTSDNGMYWTVRASSSDLNWNSICWSKKRRIFVATALTGEFIMTSGNGINWYNRRWYFPEDPIDGYGWGSVDWSDQEEKFITVGRGVGSQLCMQSYDGKIWNGITLPEERHWRCVCAK